MDPRDRYSVLKSAVLKCEDPAKIQAGLDYFFRVHEGKECPDIEALDISKKELLVEICTETINRDYIQYILKGTWGTTANEMIRILS